MRTRGEGGYQTLLAAEPKVVGTGQFAAHLMKADMNGWRKFATFLP